MVIELIQYIRAIDEIIKSAPPLKNEHVTIGYLHGLHVVRQLLKKADSINDVVESLLGDIRKYQIITDWDKGFVKGLTRALESIAEVRFFK